MTRIPHDSPELSSWLAEAKKADRALAPGPAELERLGARLAAGHASVTLLAAPAAKAMASVGVAALIGGVALSSGPGTPEPAAAPPQVVAPAELEAKAPGPRAVPPKSAEAPVVDPPAEARGNTATTGTATTGTATEAGRGAPPQPLKVHSQAPRSWFEVNNALSQGNVAEARVALEGLIATSQGPSRERAELALAQLEMHGPRSAYATSLLRRLASSAQEPSIRTRARSLLTTPE